MTTTIETWTAPETTVLPFSKPLTEENQRIIGLLLEMYEGMEQPLITFETQDSICLRVPKTIRRISWDCES